MARIRSRKEREEQLRPEEKPQSEISKEKSKELAENKFEEIVLRLAYFIKDNIKIFSLSAGLGIVLFIAVLILNYTNRQHELEALQEFEALRIKFTELDKAEKPKAKNKLRKTYARALAQFRKEYKGTDAYFHAGLWEARFRQYLGEYQKAGRIIQEYALNRDDKFIRAHYLQVAAGYFEEAGKDDLAKSIYQDIDASLEDARKNGNDIFSINYYHLGRFAEKEKDYDKALEFYQKAKTNLSGQMREGDLSNLIRSRLLITKHLKIKKKPKTKGEPAGKGKKGKKGKTDPK